MKQIIQNYKSGEL